MNENKYIVRGFLNTGIESKKFRINGKKHYLIKIEVFSSSDPNLENVEKVEYLLHPTFKDRLRTSTNSYNKFKIEFWAWGTFLVEATVYLKDSKKIAIKFDMNKELKRVAW